MRKTVRIDEKKNIYTQVGGRKMRNEIGSEFYSVPISTEENSIFPPDTKWFIAGRTALQFILKDIKTQKHLRRAALPSWCCDCMITPFLQEGIDVVFYPVTIRQGLLNIEIGDIVADVLLILDYFGYKTPVRIPDNFHGTVIRDVTHSVFRDGTETADYYFGSLRKWAGFWTGGYAWSSQWNTNREVPAADTCYVKLRQQAMTQKISYLNYVIDSKDFLRLFESAETFLDTCTIQTGTERDAQLARSLDVAIIKSTRRRNAEILLQNFSDIALFPKLNSQDCPLFVPILAPANKRDQLKKALIAEDIYCPTHWPVESVHHLTKETKVLYDCELSLVCDQRYTPEDMNRIVQSIKKHL